MVRSLALVSLLYGLSSSGAWAFTPLSMPYPACFALNRPAARSTALRSSAGEDPATVISTALKKLSSLADETVVIKYGGHAMGSEEARASFAKDVALLQSAGLQVVIVHGGGPMIADMLERLKIPTRFEGGMRVTDEATMEVAEMVLSGSINKRTVHEICSAGGSAIGLSGKDDNLLGCKPLDAALGFVGEVVQVRPLLLDYMVSELGVVPVIAPIGYGLDDGKTYNINADVAAGAIAQELCASRLLLLTDVPGVLSKDKELFRELSAEQVEDLIVDETISGGMIPKVRTALHAAKGGVGKASIIDGRIPHAILLDILGDAPAGTGIVA